MHAAVHALSLLRPRGGALERYLRALLDAGPDAARAADVARALGVSRATAGEGLRRLLDTGLAERLPDRTFALTAAGRRAARDAERRVATVERFLREFLGYDEEEARRRAARLAARLRPELAERLAERMG